MDTSRVRVFLAHLLPALQKIQKENAGCSDTLKRRRAIKLAADMCLAQTANQIAGSCWSRALNLRLHRKITKQSLSFLRSRSNRVRDRRACRTSTLVRRLRLVSLNPKIIVNVKTTNGEAVGRKVRALQRLVPGGRDMEIDVLFQETADYIMNLEMQVHAMQALADFCSAESADRCGRRVSYV